MKKKLSITILIILIIFSFVSSSILLLILFPICFGFWKINEPYYRMPYIYETYRFINYVFHIFKSSKNEIQKRKKEVIEVNLKVE